VAGWELLPRLFVVVILAFGQLLLNILRFFLWQRGDQGLGFGEKSAGHWTGFFTGCAATRIRLRIGPPMSYTPMGSLKIVPCLPDSITV
jgi:hypothetical protein